MRDLHALRRDLELAQILFALKLRLIARVPFQRHEKARLRRVDGHELRRVIRLHAPAKHRAREDQRQHSAPVPASPRERSKAEQRAHADGQCRRGGRDIFLSLEPSHCARVGVVAIELSHRLGCGDAGLDAGEPRRVCGVNGERKRGEGRDADGGFHCCIVCDFPATAAGKSGGPLETGDDTFFGRLDPCSRCGAYEVSCRAGATKCSRCRRHRTPQSACAENSVPPLNRQWAGSLSN